MDRRALSLVVGAAVVAAPAPALAAERATVTEKIPVAIRSISIASELLRCITTLVVPGGRCTTSALRIRTSRPTTHAVLVAGVAGPAGYRLGSLWSLCRPGAGCTGPGGMPGRDEVAMTLATAGGRTGPSLLEAPRLDPLAQDEEALTIIAPARSSRAAASAATQVTWIAVPPPLPGGGR